MNIVSKYSAIPIAIDEICGSRLRRANELVLNHLLKRWQAIVNRDNKDGKIHQK